MASNMSIKKGFESSRCTLMFLSVFFLVSSLRVIICIELYEPCELNNSTACEQYNYSGIICLPKSPTSPPEDLGVCNCKWNAEFPYNYTFSETSLECVAIVKGRCLIGGDEPRHCVENALCKSNATTTFGRCECLEDFMEDYENGTRSCVDRKLDYQEVCEVNGVPSKYSCKSFHDLTPNSTMPTTTLSCVPIAKGDSTKRCDCEDNLNDIMFKFHSNKCLALVNSTCDEDTDCYETSFNSTFCNDKKCKCRDKFFANDDKICVEEKLELDDPLGYNSTDVCNNSTLTCKDYSNTVACVKVENDSPRCLCKGSQDYLKSSPGYIFDDNSQICIALFGTKCDSNTTCVENSTCKPTDDDQGTCQCKDGFEHAYYKICNKTSDIYPTTESFIKAGTSTQSVTTKFLFLSSILTFILFQL